MAPTVRDCRTERRNSAFLIFGMLLLYPLRKRWRRLAFMGSVAKWLDVHVAAALTLPLLLAIHAGWRSQGIIGLGFTAMMVVWASGLIGRYVYTRIPRAKSGVELTLEEVSTQRRALIDRIMSTTGLDRELIERSLRIDAEQARRGGTLATATRMFSNDLVRWRLTRQLAADWQAAAPRGRVSRHALREAVKLAGREISLAQQARMLDATRRVLRWWHVAAPAVRVHRAHRGRDTRGGRGGGRRHLVLVTHGGDAAHDGRLPRPDGTLRVASSAHAWRRVRIGGKGLQRDGHARAARRPYQRAQLLPWCGIPQQVYEVVSACDRRRHAPPNGAAALHAVVRADVCVGCGTCVAGCPEPGAITHARQARDRRRSRSARDTGECVRACPVGAIA